MTRAEHLEWCKRRALQYVEIGDLEQAFASFGSDVTKHPETEGARQIMADLGMPMLLAGHLDTPEKMRKFIEGFR